MKFLFLASDKYPPFRVDVSVLFGRHISGRRHEIDWVLQSEENCARSYETHWMGCRVHVASTDNGQRRIARIRKHIRGFCQDLRQLVKCGREGYQFVQVKDKFAIAVFALAVARLNRVPFVYWLSFPFPEELMHRVREGTARYPLLYRIRAAVLQLLLYRVILPGAALVFVQSEKMKQDLEAKGIDPAKLKPVPMGIDLAGFPEPGPRSECTAEGPVLGYLGTLSAVRRLDFLVRVLAMVRKQYPQARLLLVGDGDDESERNLVTDEARRLGVEGAVEISGFLPRGDALRRVSEADVCLSPYYPTFVLQSTSPTKLVEYMALARPVVANDHPEQSLVIRESGGGLCVPWDEHAFAQAVCTILDDSEVASAMGKQGRAYVVANRSYERIADQVEAEYEGLLGTWPNTRFDPRGLES